jgi:hypothetical protein
MSFTSRVQAIRLHNYQLDALHLNLWIQNYDPAQVSKTLEDVEMGCASIAQVWSPEGCQNSRLPPEIDLKIKPRYIIETREQYMREVERKAGHGNFLRPRDAYVIDRVIYKLVVGSRVYLHVRMKDCYQYLMPINLAQIYLKDQSDEKANLQNISSEFKSAKQNNDLGKPKSPFQRRKLAEISRNSTFNQYAYH